MKFLISHVAITKKAGRVPAFFMIANYKTLLIKYTFWQTAFGVKRLVLPHKDKYGFVAFIL